MRTLLTCSIVATLLLVGSSAWAQQAPPTEVPLTHMDGPSTTPEMLRTLWQELGPRGIDLDVASDVAAATADAATPSMVPVGALTVPGNRNLALKVKLSPSQFIGQLVCLL